MDIASENILNQLLSSSEILATVSEAVAFWRADPTQVELLAEALVAIDRAIENAVPAFPASHGSAANKLRKGATVLRSKTGDCAAFEQLFDQIHRGFLEICNVVFMNQLRTPPDLPPELAQRLFSYAHALPSVGFDNVKASLMWLVAVGSSASLPLESYKYAMEAFVINPQLPSAFSIDKPQYIPGETRYTQNCPVCQGAGKPYYAAHQLLAINYESFFQPVKLWMKCADCDTIFAYNFPVLSQEDFVGCDSSSMNASIQPRFPLYIFADIVKDIRRHTSGRTFLDVGIGNGELMAAADEMGYDVEGVEISLKEAAKVSNQLGLSVHCCDFLDFSSQKRYDIIILGDVVEHLSAPVAALEKAYALLETGGVLWLSTPNYNSAFSRFNRFRDPMWREPWHVSYFSLDSLLPFLTRLGFELLEYNVSKHYNGSMELILKKAQG